MEYIDLHCDTLCRSLLCYSSSLEEIPEAMVDIKRLKKGGAKAQFFAMYLMREGGIEAEKDINMPSPDELIRIMHQIYTQTLSKCKENLKHAGNYSDLQRNYNAGKISAFLTVEDGYAVQGKLKKIKDYYEMGVRLLTLLWNYPNCFGFPNSTERNIMERGLTTFGKEAVGYMNELGMIIDVSHLSDGGFWDVVSLSRKPFVASHSNARTLTPHPRNLSDDMIKTIGNKGGVIGINFAPQFLSRFTDKSRIEDICRHILYIINQGGEECAALGTDFDGIEGNLEISDCSNIFLLFDALYKLGVSSRKIEKIAYKNVERVIKETL